MTIITAITEARDRAKCSKLVSETVASSTMFNVIQRTLPKLHTVTINQPTARRIAAELVAANVSFVAEPSGLKVTIAVKQEDIAVLNAAITGA